MLPELYPHTKYIVYMVLISNHVVEIGGEYPLEMSRMLGDEQQGKILWAHYSLAPSFHITILLKKLEWAIKSYVVWKLHGHWTGIENLFELPLDVALFQGWPAVGGGCWSWRSVRGGQTGCQRTQPVQCTVNQSAVLRKDQFTANQRTRYNISPDRLQ